MTLLPGWNSVDAVSGIAHWLHISAIVVLALLVVAEGMALIYDSRKDTLVAAAERASAEQRQRDQQKADDQHRAEVAQVQRQLEETRKQQAARRLSEEQKQTLISAILPFAGQKFILQHPMGDSEAAFTQWISVFKHAKWIDVGNSPLQTVWTGGVPVGIEVTLNQVDAEEAQKSGKMPSSVFTLLKTLGQFGLVDEHKLFMNAEVAPQTIDFRVGAKPSVQHH